MLFNIFCRSFSFLVIGSGTVLTVTQTLTPVLVCPAGAGGSEETVDAV